jgi:glycosyltransferase involved in cell wall biosynthesis
MHIAFVLPGLHRTPRGAEAAFEAIGGELASTGQDHVTLFGSGRRDPARTYDFVHVWSMRHERFERFPRVPPLRTEYAYEELTFMPALAARYRAAAADVTLTCSYPFVNWYLSRRPRSQARRPKHVFVTQNGDWPACSDDAEYRLFSCDGLVATNPEYFERNRARWNSALIPNGVDTSRYSPGPGDRERLGIPSQRPVVLMVSALAPSKRVAAGVQAVARLPEAFLVVAGDGPERHTIDEMAADLLPGRFLRLVLQPAEMPCLYRCADVLLHASTQESFGNVYAEALACGLPIVTHDYSLTRWVLGDHGHLVDAFSQEELVRGLSAALAEGSGAAQTRAAYAADRFAWERIAADYRSFLLSVVGARRGEDQPPRLWRASTRS